MRCFSLRVPSCNLARFPRRVRGVALVLVLSFLVLITGLVLAFFISINTELNGAKSYSVGESSKQLADSVTQFVIGSIRQATAGGTDVAWASQPGMIRTYDNSGKAKTCYKLFSSSALQVSAPYSPSGEIDTNWTSEPALFTDLNAPVVNSAGNASYPILDPGASGMVDGFFIDPSVPTAYTGSYPPPGNFNPASQPNPAPMPVRWLYVLKDGSLATPTVGTTTVSFGGTNVPSAANPITARVAYWTDDETSKVNVNTASEGTYWDIPRVVTLEDCGVLNGTAASTPGLALCQPTTGEYQRYPGHPATTCLSPVLHTLLSAPDPAQPNTASNFSLLQNYYDLAPRVNYRSTSNASGSLAGSRGGTVIADPSSNATSTTGKIVPDTDRLYASVDELMFKPTADGSGNRTVNLPTNNTQGVTSASLSAALQKTKFFLTAHSNAPEVTMFNTPRVAMWPMWGGNNVGLRTLYDSTVAFCSTIAGNGTTPFPYYFTRTNSRNPSFELTKLPRNTVLYQYLLQMMSTPEPGFGGTFSGKFGADNAQVLTSIYDYIRCINLYDKSPASGNAPAATPYTQLATINAATAGAGEVLPTTMPNGTQGFGRYYTVSEVDLVFCGVPKIIMVPNTSPTDPDADKLVGMQAVLFVEFNSPMNGLPGVFPAMSFTVSGLDAFKADGQTLFTKNSAGNNGTDYIQTAPVMQLGGRGIGGADDPHMTWYTYGPFNPPKSASPATAMIGSYPFVSTNNITLSQSSLGGTFPFVGGNITITLKATDTANTIQTLQMNFPGATFPTPQVLPKTTPLVLYNGPVTGYSGRYNGIVTIAQDTVRAVEVGGVNDDGTHPTFGSTNTTAGDVRMIAALPNVPAKYFYPHLNYNSTSIMQASGLISGDGTGSTQLWAGSTQGALAKGMHGSTGNPMPPHYWTRNPNLPSRSTSAALTGVTRADGGPGDWDTGYGCNKDGAYLNMGDIGDFCYTDQEDSGHPPRYPYISKEDHYDTGNGVGSYFSPNRQVPSSMVLGSIPTGVQRNLPWQTLLFNSKPEDPTHPGRGVMGSTPPDHLIADLFWMPVVDPYAISQPFSTAGKINMNYQMEPFTYILRKTGMYAVMKATKIPAISADLYKTANPRPYSQSTTDVTNNEANFPSNTTIRYAIDIPTTLQGFDNYFTNNNDIFRSATQISEINLVPAGQGSVYDTTQFWQNHTVTGDNLREKPYADIYPRLTTKSNSYTIHYRVQTLQKSPSTSVSQWVEGRDQIVSEYRGSSEIERYIDVQDPALPDFAQLMATNASDPNLNLDKYYRYRVVSTKRFSP